MNATPSQTHRPHVTVKKDTNVILRMNIGSVSGVVVQTSKTTTETWTGLLFTDADDLCETYEESILGGVTRTYLGSVKLTLASGGTSIWNTKEACWGKKVTTDVARIGDTNLYFVTKTTVEYGVTHSGGTMQLL